MNDTPLEDVESTMFAQYLQALQLQKKVLDYTHTANETYTKSWGTKMKNKRMGVTKGIPDFIIVTKKALVFIEMKRVKGGVISPEQKSWIESLKKVGQVAEITKGFDEAKIVIDKYI